MGTSHIQISIMNTVALCVLVLAAVASARPRYLVIPLEDVEFMDGAPRLPIYTMPGLARQTRQVQQEEDMELIQPQRYIGQRRQDEPASSSSNSYAAPAAPAGPDHVDYGAYAGGYGSFGWYTDHPVALRR